MSATTALTVGLETAPAQLTEAFARRGARIAAVLFVPATASTMADQIILEGLEGGADMSEALQSSLISLAVSGEIPNGRAKAWIALALFPVLRHVSELAATGYPGMRIEMGSSRDLILSLPIWINGMVLAVWLFLRGFDPGAVESETDRGK